MSPAAPVRGRAMSRLNRCPSVKRKEVSAAGFFELMHTVSDGWNEGNARKAADCFALDAVYTEPPDKQVYRGRSELFEFFGGEERPEPPMSMRWHHLAFNEKDQIGFGEYTFQCNFRYHGIVVVKLQDGKIGHWREYQYRSDLGWEAFTPIDPF